MLYFRIAVPGDLRKCVGGRELTRTLKTTDRPLACPIALSLASKAKILFNELRERMGKKKSGTYTAESKTTPRAIMKVSYNLLHLRNGYAQAG